MTAQESGPLFMAAAILTGAAFALETVVSIRDSESPWLPLSGLVCAGLLVYGVWRSRRGSSPGV